MTNYVPLIGLSMSLPCAGAFLELPLEHGIVTPRTLAYIFVVVFYKVNGQASSDNANQWSHSTTNCLV